MTASSIRLFAAVFVAFSIAVVAYITPNVVPCDELTADIAQGADCD